MVRTQIQLPEPLYREMQRIAREHDWSLAEVLRRGAEAVARAYPASDLNKAATWRLPPPITSRLLISDPETLRDATRDDQEACMG
jgi:hypothetical protein